MPIESGDGTSAGIGAASGAGSGTYAINGVVVCTSPVTGAGGQTIGRAGTASGLGAALGALTSIFLSVGTGAGAGAASGVGTKVEGRTVAAAGTATVLASASHVLGMIGTVSGIGAATAAAIQTGAGAGSSVPIATVLGALRATSATTGLVICISPTAGVGSLADQLPVEPHRILKKIGEWKTTRKEWPNGRFSRRREWSTKRASFELEWDGITKAEIESLETFFDNKAGTYRSFVFIDTHQGPSAVYNVTFDQDDFTREMTRANLRGLYRLKLKIVEDKT